jgi:plastocyanin
MTSLKVTHVCISLAAMLAAGVVRAAGAGLEVRVMDREGRPVGDVVIYATSVDGPQRAATPNVPTATMEQTGNAFVPHLLVVETGSEVTFPNNDDVSHHVYSFSDTKTFELALYRGNVHPPVRFDEPGLVVLGCNIHDGMLGYIFIVDTPHFARTAADGRASIGALSPGRYAVGVWTPRVRERDLPRAATVSITESAAASLVIRLEGKLKPPHAHGGASLTWDRY